MTNDTPTIRWRPGTKPRKAFRLNGRWWVWKSEHPQEERCIELTDDYRDENGDYLPPELEAWDGVDSCPGIVLSSESLTDDESK